MSHITHMAGRISTPAPEAWRRRRTVCRVGPVLQRTCAAPHTERDQRSCSLPTRCVCVCACVCVCSCVCVCVYACVCVCLSHIHSSSLSRSLPFSCLFMYNFFLALALSPFLTLARSVLLFVSLALYLFLFLPRTKSLSLSLALSYSRALFHARCLSFSLLLCPQTNRVVIPGAATAAESESALCLANPRVYLSCASSKRRECLGVWQCVAVCCRHEVSCESGTRRDCLRALMPQTQSCLKTPKP